jgi:hypothetical protein
VSVEPRRVFRCEPDESAGLADELYRRAIDARLTSEDEALELLGFSALEREASLRDPAGWPSIAEASRMIRERIARAWRRLAA